MTELNQNLTDKQLYRIKYNQEHKEQIKAYKNECQYCFICEGSYNRKNKYIHDKSIKHMKALENQIPE